MKGSDFSFDNRRRERVGTRLLIRYPSILWPLRSGHQRCVLSDVDELHAVLYVKKDRVIWSRISFSILTTPRTPLRNTKLQPVVLMPKGSLGVSSGIRL